MSKPTRKPNKQKSLNDFFRPGLTNTSQGSPPVIDNEDRPTTSSDTTDTEPSLASTSSASTLLFVASGSGSTTKNTQKVSDVKKRKFMSSWLDEFSWLTFEEDSQLMFCEYCRKEDVGGKSDFISGVSIFKKESLTAHNKSKRHETCKNKCLKHQEPPSKYAIVQSFETGIKEQTNKLEAELKVKFNTAYVIAKEEMAFTKFKTLLILQKKNGLDISPTYDNDVRCAEIISTISEELKLLSQEKLKATDFISVMIDGATDRSVAENEVLYVRFIENGKPVNRMVALCELEHAHATGLIEGIKKAFTQFGITNYHDKLIGFCADGASVNLGQTNGVVAKLRDSVAHLIDIHCMAHRLELSLLELKNKNSLMKTLNDVLHLIWKTYKNSPKSKRELNVLGSELDSKVYSPAPVKGTRWVPHVNRALQIFIESKHGMTDQPSQYAVIYAHMEHLASSSKSPEMAGRGKFITKEMSTFSFVTFAHFMCDVFGILKNISLNFQKPDLILPSAINVIKECTLLLEDAKTNPLPGGYLSKWFDCVDAQLRDREEDSNTIKFQGIVVKCNDSNYKEVSMRKFSAVLDLILKEINTRFKNLLGANKDDRTAETVKAFSVFNHDTWPTSDGELLHYGNDSIQLLTDWFRLPLERAGCVIDSILLEWRQMKLLVGNEFKTKSYSEVWEILLTKTPYSIDFRNVLMLIQILLVLPISSADCERCFSAQKRIKSDTRSSLSVQRLSDLIYISTEGPEVASFVPDKSVQRWLKAKHRILTAKPRWNEQIHEVD